MRTYLDAAARFAREEDAPTMLEYGLLIASVVILVAMSGHLLARVCGEILQDAATVAKVR
ncbi:MAG: hypothetical protein U0935_18280 [Pirellulales bacterium]